MNHYIFVVVIFAGQPRLYINIAKYVDWINSTMEKNKHDYDQIASGNQHMNSNSNTFNSRGHRFFLYLNN